MHSHQISFPLLLSIFFSGCEAVRVAGPIMTVTLRDPYFTPQQRSGSGEDAIKKMEENSSLSSLSLSSLNPEIAYSLRSNEGGPFPKRLPGLKMLSATAYYKYELLERMPHAFSFFAGIRIRPFQFPKSFPRMNQALLHSDTENEEGDKVSVKPTSAAIRLPDMDDDDRVLNLSFSPTYSVKSKTGSGEIKVWGNNIKRWSAITRFRLPYPFASGEAKNKKSDRLISFASATCKIFLPFAAISSLTVTPSYNAVSPIYPLSLQMTAESGSSKTSAVLNLNIEDPSLSLIHQLDERNVIAPEIYLHNAKIMYNWTTQLPNGMLRTRVDPTSAIQVTWVDKAGGSGRWVTDFKLPLEGFAGPLAADIRVQRQFVF